MDQPLSPWGRLRWRRGQSGRLGTLSPPLVGRQPIGTEGLHRRLRGRSGRGMADCWLRRRPPRDSDPPRLAKSRSPVVERQQHLLLPPYRLGEAQAGGDYHHRQPIHEAHNVEMWGRRPGYSQRGTRSVVAALGPRSLSQALSGLSRPPFAGKGGPLGPGQAMEHDRGCGGGDQAIGSTAVVLGPWGR